MSQDEELIERGRCAFDAFNPLYSHERMEVGKLLTDRLEALAQPVVGALKEAKAVCERAELRRVTPVVSASGEVDMPTIWEDPAGKGYPCFERSMTPKEARETIERFGARIAALESAIGAWIASPSPDTEQMVMDTLSLSTSVTEAAQERDDA
jgi:hypothetical protein